MTRRILNAVAQLPIYVLVVAALSLVIATANDAPHITTTTGQSPTATSQRDTTP